MTTDHELRRRARFEVPGEAAGEMTTMALGGVAIRGGSFDLPLAPAREPACQLLRPDPSGGDGISAATDGRRLGIGPRGLPVASAPQDTHPVAAPGRIPLCSPRHGCTVS
jgi:hypothetical protein